MFVGLYNETRAAQSVAYLLSLAGGSLNLLKLTKLLYLAEKRSYDKYGEPLTGDSPCSLEHGPVLSNTYDHTKSADAPTGVWGQWIQARQGNLVMAAKKLEDPPEELLALSRADLAVMDEIWAEFGQMGSWELRNWTHDNCSEWEDPGSSSSAIDPEDLLQDLGLSESEVKERKTYLRGMGRLNRALAAR